MAAPTIHLNVISTAASRQSPCPVFANVDMGERWKSVVDSGEGYEWEPGDSVNVLNYQVSADNMDGDQTADGTTQFSAIGDNYVMPWAHTSDPATRRNAIWIFDGVTIPAGQSIISAILSIHASATSIKCTLYGEDVDDAADLTATPDINSRTLTTASVLWDPPFSGLIVEDEWNDGPDISSVVQEVYDRTGSLAGVNLAIIGYGAGDANRQGAHKSYFNDPNLAAKLEIQYTAGTPSGEYRLTTPLVDLTETGNAPTNIRVLENDVEMTEGTRGSLAEGEFALDGGYLYVKISGGTDPELEADGYIRVAFDVSVPGDGSTWDQCLVQWQLEADGDALANWPAKYHYVTDPRPRLASKQIDMAGLTDTDNYNRPRGPGFAWVLTEGTWRVKVTVTNPSGESTTVTSSDIVIAADTRTTYTVQASGGDYTSLKDAISARGATDDVKIVVEDGHTENLTGSGNAFEITGDNVYVTQAGTGTKPKFTYSDSGETGSVILFLLNGENVLIEGLELAESTGNVGVEGVFIYGVHLQNTACAAVSVHLDGDPTGVSSDSKFRLTQGFQPANITCNGALIFKCSSIVTRGYSYVAAGGDYQRHIVTIGNDFGYSTNESVFRTTGPEQYITCCWSKHANNASKSALRFARSNWNHAYGCYFVDGDIWIGTAGSGLGAHVTRTEACCSAGLPSGGPGFGLSAYDNVQDYTAANWVLDVDSEHNPKINFGNQDTPESNKFDYKNCRFLANTVYARDSAGTHNAPFIAGGTSNGQDRFSAGNAAVGNLFVFEDPDDPDTYLAQMGDAIATVQDNVFPATAPNLLAWGSIYVGTSADHDDADLAAFNAESWASGNTEKDVTLDADYVPDDPTTITTPTGVYDDYYGNPRSSESWAGAVGSDPAAAGGGGGGGGLGLVPVLGSDNEFLGNGP